MKSIKSPTHFVYFINIKAIINNDKVKGKTINVYKVGYSHDVAKRVKAFTNVEKPSSVVKGLGIKIINTKVIKIVPFPTIDLAKNYESHIKIKYVKHRYFGHPILANGNTELFNINILELEAAELPAFGHNL